MNLLELLHDEAKARMMGAAGRVKAANEYSAGKMADKMLKIYRSAANPKVAKATGVPQKVAKKMVKEGQSSLKKLPNKVKK